MATKRSPTLNPSAGKGRGLAKPDKSVGLATYELEAEIDGLPQDERGEPPHLYGRRIAEKMAKAYEKLVEDEDEERLRQAMPAILYDLGMGVTYDLAAQSAGVPLHTAARWLREGGEKRDGLKREFYLACQQVWAQHTAFGIKTLFRGMLKGNVKLAMWYMERALPQRFAKAERAPDDEERSRFLQAVEKLVHESGIEQLGLPKGTIEMVEDEE